MYEDMMGLVGIRVQKEKPIVARPVTPLYTSPPAQQEPVAFDVIIEDEEALAALRDTVVQSDGDLTAIRLLVGNGHAGYGLYVCVVEYQEEGAFLLAHTSPPASKPLTDADLGMYISKELAEYSNGAYADTGCAKDQLIHFARAIEAAHGIKGEA